jgi:predicted kinase
MALECFDLERVKWEITEQLSRELGGCCSRNKPILLLIGGFPGAGKTTLIRALCQADDFAVIAWNDIRQALLDRHLLDSLHVPEIIWTVNHALFRTCLERRVNIIIDANAHCTNIKLFEDLLEAERFSHIYQVVKICLNPPLHTLLDRVSARVQIEGVHQGTVADVLKDTTASFKQLNKDDYSLIIKNDGLVPFETELCVVTAFLRPFLCQCSCF